MTFIWIRQWVLGFAVAITAGCAAPVTSTNGDALSVQQLTGAHWLAVWVEGLTSLQSPRPSLRWADDGQLAGSGGCNNFAGRTNTANGAFVFASLAPAGKACLTAPLGQEDKFFKAIESTRSARLDKDQLVLLADDGRTVARFARIPFGK